jgi:hypothetical protein
LSWNGCVILPNRSYVSVIKALQKLEKIY